MQWVRLIAPASKLATARMLDPATAASSLGDILGLGAVDEDELYAAIDWLGERQGAIEQAQSKKKVAPIIKESYILRAVNSEFRINWCAS
jgi:hypothetical protein